jgi:integrator complex subunit 4
MTKDCVKMVLDSVLDNLKKYPHDKKSIWKCLQGVGKNHPWVILPLVPQLLSMHPFLDTNEQDPEDPGYVSVLILVFNAAKGCNTMQILFDEKLMRHYHYLRDTLKNLVPDLNESTVEKPSVSNSGRMMVKELTLKLKNELSPEMKEKLSKLILKDLKVC